MIKGSFFTLFLLVLVLSISCRKNFEYIESTGQLQFSKDTVFLDTVFAGIGSSTYSFKVYNRTDDDIQIPIIKLKSGESSHFRMNVNGQAGKNIENVSLYAKDSLFVFIEVTAEATQNESSFLYTDAVEFVSSYSSQQVVLVTLVQNAIFLYPKNENALEYTLQSDYFQEPSLIKGFGLTPQELNFTAELPYVIYGNAIVPPESIMNIDAGARLHFHKDAALYLANGAQLNVNGILSEDQKVLEGEIIFEGNRLEPEFAEVPGQWTGIILDKGSGPHTIEYLTVKNAELGLWVHGDGHTENIQLNLRNSQFYNNSVSNLWFFNSFANGQNVVVGNSPGASIIYQGGKYQFTHCTFANYFSQGHRATPTVTLTNFMDSGTNQLEMPLTEVIVENSVIDGFLPQEFLVLNSASVPLNYLIKNCSIQFENNNDSAPWYNFDNPDYYEGVFLNLESHFVNPKKNIFQLKETSAFIDKGNAVYSEPIPTDILGKTRLPYPDLGSYEY